MHDDGHTLPKAILFYSQTTKVHTIGMYSCAKQLSAENIHTKKNVCIFHSVELLHI